MGAAPVSTTTCLGFTVFIYAANRDAFVIVGSLPDVGSLTGCNCWNLFFAKQYFSIPSLLTFDKQYWVWSHEV